jgi:hypothetical protein
VRKGPRIWRAPPGPLGRGVLGYRSYFFCRLVFGVAACCGSKGKKGTARPFPDLALACPLTRRGGGVRRGCYWD